MEPLLGLTILFILTYSVILLGVFIREGVHMELRDTMKLALGMATVITTITAFIWVFK